MLALRQAIHHGDMAPGQRLVEIEMAEAFGVTRAGLRAALVDLTAEGNAKAAEHATDEQIAHLVDIGERLRACVRAGEPLKYSDLNQELHRHVQQVSGQEIAMGLLGRLNAQLVRHRFRLAPQPGRPQVSLAQHLAIIDAIRDRDPHRAERAAREHLASVIAALGATPR